MGFTSVIPRPLWGSAFPLHPQPCPACEAVLFREASLARRQLSCPLKSPAESVTTRRGSATRRAPWLIENAVGLMTDSAARLDRPLVRQGYESVERWSQQNGSQASPLQVSGSRRFRGLQRQPLSSLWYEARGQSGALPDPTPRGEFHGQV